MPQPISKISHANSINALQQELLDFLIDAQHLDNTQGTAKLTLRLSPKLLPLDKPEALKALSSWIKQLIEPVMLHQFERCPAGHHSMIFEREQKNLSQKPNPPRVTPRAAETTTRNTRYSNLNNRSTDMNDIIPERNTFVPKTSALPRKPSLFSRLGSWLMGKSASANPDTTNGNLNKSNPPEPLGIVVDDAPVTDCLQEAFHQGLTQATSEFVRKHVNPLHRLDESSLFSVRVVRVGMNEQTRIYLEALEKMPDTLRTRLAKKCIERAGMAAQQLCLDDFFGLSIVPENAAFGYGSVDVLLAYTGERPILKFAFEGDFIERPIQSNSNSASQTPEAKPTAKQPNPVEQMAKSQYTQSSTEIDTIETEIQLPDTPVSKQQASKQSASVAKPRTETPLNLPGKTSSQRSETKLVIPVMEQPKAIAKLIISYSDQIDDEETILIQPHQFPFMIGREPEGYGYEIDEQRGDYVVYASRKHLILEGFDPVDQAFSVTNLIKESRTTYTYDQAGRLLGEKFLWTFGSRLILGQNKRIELRMEPV